MNEGRPGGRSSCNSIWIERGASAQMAAVGIANSMGMSTSTGRNSASGKAESSPFFFNSCRHA